MCVFSGAVQSVSKTRIFGRLDDAGWQYLVYQMEFSADDEVAMILPFPADRTGKPEFINLEKIPGFFKGLDKAFPQPRMRSTRGGMMTKGMSFSAPLEVHNVGAFEGSFVPTIDDFGRLDKRFRLPEATLESMKKLYQEFSFAVFKLKAGTNQKVHPMAFKFPSAQLDRVFFPTIHVHDGTLPKYERFDHSFYIQVPESKLQQEITLWEETRPSHTEVSPESLIASIPDRLRDALQGVVTDARGLKMTMHGRFENVDIPFILIGYDIV